MVNRIILNETSCHGAGAVKGVAFLAKSAYADACRPGNPRDLTVKDIEKLYQGLA